MKNQHQHSLTILFNLILTIASKMLGTFILWFGWIGFNAGSSIRSGGNFNPAVVSVAVVNTIISGSVSGIVALLTNLIITERLTGEPHYNLGYAMNGCLTGLAAITGWYVLITFSTRAEATIQASNLSNFLTLLYTAVGLSSRIQQ